MRIVSDDMESRWLDQFKMGNQRPVVRAIIQRQNLKKFEYDTAWAQGGTYDTSKHRTGHFTSMIFGDQSAYREIPNILSYSWERSVSQDVATCTITLLNTEMTPIGSARDNPTSPDEFDKPGYFTFNRGDNANRWGYDSETGWNGIFVPDMVVKTYEGYGCDRTKTPPLDPNLVQSGIWLIDDVEYRSDGLITLTMRDLARLLVTDSISFPPIVPMGEYPLTWVRTHSEDLPSRDASGGYWSGKLKEFGTASSSNEAFIGAGLTNAPFTRYVGPTGGVEGHHPSHALIGDNDNDLYWRSTGQDATDDFVWWEFEPNATYSPMPVAALRLKCAGGPYRVYISIDQGDGWEGKRKIGYHVNGITGTPGNVDIGAHIPFVKALIADRFYALDTNLPEVMGATKIRLTFSRLHQSEVGEHPFRAGLRQMQVYTAASVDDLSYVDGTKHRVVGNYSDYTHIVKWCCAWAGFYWPPHETNLDFIRIQDGDGDATTSKNWITFAHPDPALPKGRVWGDFMKTGTGGEADLTAENFDKRPLMDSINYVRDIVGYVFFIDEMGGVVWRMPNLGLDPDMPDRLGNYLSPMTALDDGSPKFRGRYGRTDEIVTLDESENLFAYSTKLSSQNIRERIFVGNSVGGVGTVIKGFNPYPVGLRRIAGWCVDTETEIFTRRGWLRYDQVRAGDETLSLASDGRSVWQPIREVAVFDAEPRDMIELSANNFSAVTTANHRWPVERYNTATKKWALTETASEKLTAMDRIVRAAPGVRPVEAIHDDALVELVAWTYTEGTVRRSARSWRQVSIHQSEVANPANCDRIRRALEKVFPGQWIERNRRERGLVWTLRAGASRGIVAHLDELKAPTMEFLSALTQEQLGLFIDVSVMADGWERKTSEFSKTPSRFFSQNVGPRLDAFLAACALAGVATSYHVRPGDELGHLGHHDHATVCLLQSRYYLPAQTKSGRERRVTSEVVWCPSMPEHHNWLARRNGSIYYTSNTDQHFKNKTETVVMADMISARSMFTYRLGQSVIPGYPKIQIDDVVRIYERVTNETFYHYVMGIKSELDVERGEWTYSLETHWLGTRPEDAWVVDVTELAGATQQYLAAIGYVPTDSQDNGSSDPTTNMP